MWYVPLYMRLPLAVVVRLQELIERLKERSRRGNGQGEVQSFASRSEFAINLQIVMERVFLSLNMERRWGDGLVLL